jgi:hypothetical protein
VEAKFETMGFPDSLSNEILTLTIFFFSSFFKLSSLLEGLTNSRQNYLADIEY